VGTRQHSRLCTETKTEPFQEHGLSAGSQRYPHSLTLFVSLGVVVIIISGIPRMTPVTPELASLVPIMSVWDACDISGNVGLKRAGILVLLHDILLTEMAATIDTTLFALVKPGRTGARQTFDMPPKLSMNGVSACALIRVESTESLVEVRIAGNQVDKGLSSRRRMVP
jgi:hypothetical protein